MRSGDGDRSIGAVMVWVAVVFVVVTAAMGCVRDPLDPHGELARRAVDEMEWAERQARGRDAYGRSRSRVGRVQPGMSVASVEVAMGAFIAMQSVDEDENELQLSRRKLIEGFLCSSMPSGLRKRWLFGYDEGEVELIGFAIEFEREDTETEKWRLRRIDREPKDDCEQK